MKLNRFEKDQLWQIGRPPWDRGAPYWWGVKTMPKLAARGLVEPHPEHRGAWRITDAGRKVLADLKADGRL